MPVQKAETYDNLCTCVSCQVFAKFKNLHPVEINSVQKVVAEKTTRPNNYALTQEEVAYIFKNKKYPLVLPKSCLNVFKKFCKNEALRTSRTCLCTGVKLSSSIKYCSSTKIFDISGVYDKICLYHRKCQSCGIRYFYREYGNGIHVADNNLILSLRLRLLIRKLLAHNSATGWSFSSLIDWLSELFGTELKIPANYGR